MCSVALATFVEYTAPEVSYAAPPSVGEYIAPALSTAAAATFLCTSRQLSNVAAAAFLGCIAPPVSYVVLAPVVEHIAPAVYHVSLALVYEYIALAGLALPVENVAPALAVTSTLVLSGKSCHDELRGPTEVPTVIIRLRDE